MLALPNCSGPCMNVLYLLSDDMRADWGAYALPTKTPNLDRLAAEGLLFTHAYCQMSVCSPSRQSFMTSRRPDKNKVWNFLDHNPLSTQATPGHFRDAGYLALGLGKTFHENGGAWNADRYWSTDARPYYPYSANTCPIGGGAAATASRRTTRSTTIAFASRRWTTSALRRRRGETRRARFT